MYCPQCSRQQTTGNIKFCPQCGFQLEAVMKLLSNNGLPQKIEENPPDNIFLRSLTSPRGGIKLIFFSIVILPFIFISAYLFDSPIPFTIPLLIFFTGLSQAVYLKLFGKKHAAERENDFSKKLTAPDSNTTINLLAAKLSRELQQTDGFSALIIEGLMLELIAETSRNYVKVDEPIRPPWLKEVEEMLQDKFSDQLALSEIARFANVHPTHLARVFRQYHQCTIGEYIRKLRIKHSCQQLLLTETPLIDIALEAGFYDQSHFSRCFKQLTGLTPTEYRATHQVR